MLALQKRFERVRVCCGSWDRITGYTPTEHNGLTGVFLDPPYGEDRDMVYACDSGIVNAAVHDWCLENGGNPMLRIALCGYDGEHNDLEKMGWDVFSWKAQGGYGNQSGKRGRDNVHKERMWFSPHCISVTAALPIFASLLPR
jgi:hypothetical protein